MANRNQLLILKTGVKAWNRWRQAHPKITPNLIGADLFERKLNNVNFRGCNLKWSNLSGAHLERAHFEKAILDGADLSGASLEEACLQGANLYATNLVGTDMTRTDFSGANLVGAKLQGASFDWTNLRKAILTDADFGASDINSSDFAEAVMSNTIFWYTDFKNCSFRNATLYGTVFSDTDLKGVLDLETCHHEGPSALDHLTLMKSGILPTAFLRGCGLPDKLIDFLPTLTNADLFFYSCFISYTDADSLFADRLYNDLQRRGIRCWQWREDAKWGRPLMGEINSAVHTFDKVVVVCSKDSLESPPVIREIERALQKEDELKRLGKDPSVLFPIRLDDSIFAWSHHRKADVIEKNVGDFREWMTDSKYYASFERLVRNLRIEKSAI